MKRFMLIGAVLLAIGALLNVAVAWGWAAWGVPPHRDNGVWTLSHDQSPCWLMHGQGGLGASVVRVAALFVDERGFRVFRNLGRTRGDVPQSIASRFTDPPMDEMQYTCHGFDERGWPMRCLRSEHSYRWVNRSGNMIGDVQVIGGIQLWPKQTARGGWALQRVRALPLMPIWPAFILNTLLYTLLATSAFIGYPKMIRSLGWARTRRRAIAAVVLALPLMLGLACATAVFYENEQISTIPSADRRPNSDDRTAYLLMDRQDRLGGTRLIFNTSFSNSTDNDRMPAPPIDGAAPFWATAVLNQAREREWRSFEWMTAETVGWPMRAFSSSFTTRLVDQFTTVLDVHSGIRLDELPGAMQLEAPRTMRMLPTQIIWRGLMFNWLVYAVILFALIAAPGTIKRAFRLRRGRCAECSYDLRGDFNGGCPECGWRRARPPAD